MKIYLAATSVEELRDLLADVKVKHYVLYPEYDSRADGNVIPVYLCDDPDISIDSITPEELLVKSPFPSPELKRLLSIMDEGEDLVIIDWKISIITTERIYEEFKKIDGWTFYVVVLRTTDEVGFEVFKPLDGQLFKSPEEAEEAAKRWIESWSPENRIISAIRTIYDEAKVVWKASRQKFRQYILDGGCWVFDFPEEKDGTIVELNLWEDPASDIQSLWIFAFMHPQFSRLLGFLDSEEGERWRDWKIVYYKKAPEVLLVPPGEISDEDFIFYAVSYQGKPLGGKLFDTKEEARKAWREFLKELKKNRPKRKRKWKS